MGQPVAGGEVGLRLLRDAAMAIEGMRVRRCTQLDHESETDDPRSHPCAFVKQPA